MIPLLVTLVLSLGLAPAAPSASLAPSTSSAESAQSEGSEPSRSSAPGVAREPARVEVFALELGAAGDRVGWVEWRRRALEPTARGETGFQLECSLFFVDEALRVEHVERLGVRSSALVWRELLPARGRTVLAQWAEGAKALRFTAWGPEGRLRGELGVVGGCVLPLYLVELCRAGLVTGGRFRVFDPRTLELEAVTLATRFGETGAAVAADPPAGRPREAAASEPGRLVERTVELRRADGSLCGRWAFDGEDLVAFQWQEGGLVARRMDAAGWSALREAFAAAASPLSSALDGARPASELR